MALWWGLVRHPVFSSNIEDLDGGQRRMGVRVSGRGEMALF
jgi:hypothetical protein